MSLGQRKILAVAGFLTNRPSHCIVRTPSKICSHTCTSFQNDRLVVPWSTLIYCLYVLCPTLHAVLSERFYQLFMRFTNNENLLYLVKTNQARTGNQAQEERLYTVLCCVEYYMIYKHFRSIWCCLFCTSDRNSWINRQNSFYRIHLLARQFGEPHWSFK